MRLRYVADRDGNVVVSPLPDPDFRETDEATEGAKKSFERDVRGLTDAFKALVKAVAAEKLDPNVYDDAGHKIGNYL